MASRRGRRIAVNPNSGDVRIRGRSALGDDEYSRYSGSSANGYVDDVLAESPEERRGRFSRTSADTYDDFSGVYDDEGYEDYGELGSNYNPEDDPDWGYDYYDTYDKPVPDWENSRANRYADYMSRPLDERERPEREIGTTPNTHRPQWESGPTSSSSEEDEYLEYLDKYDRGDIDNYEMSRIQRRYANSPFWDTFRPSEELIEQYGSGNRSTRWPMFERRGGRWRPVFWRND